MSRSAFNEALAYARAGIALIPGGGEAGRVQREFDLQNALAGAAMAIEGFGSPVTTQCYRRMLELARESGDEAALSTALSGVWMDHNVAARHEEADEVARQMLEVAERSKSPAALRGRALRSSVDAVSRGDCGGILPKLKRATALCRDGAGRVGETGSDPIAWSLSFEGRMRLGDRLS